MFMICIPLAVYVIRFWGKGLRWAIRSQKQIGRRLQRMHSAATAAFNEQE